MGLLQGLWIQRPPSPSRIRFSPRNDSHPVAGLEVATPPFGGGGRHRGGAVVRRDFFGLPCGSDRKK